MSSRVSVTKLQSPEDWEEALSSFARLEGFSATDPWQDCMHCRSMQEVFWDQEPLWMVLVEDGGTPVLMSILKKEHRSGLERAVLRSIDSMVLYTDSLWSAPEHIDSALSLLRGQARVISRTLGVDAIELYRQSRAESQRFAPYQRSLFTTALKIDLSQGIESWHEHIGSKRYRDIQRRGRKLSREHAEPVIRHRRGDLFSLEGFEEDWKAYEALRRGSWQLVASESSGKSSVTQIEQYVSKMARHWSSKGSLELVEMLVDGSLVASHLNIVSEDRIWMYVMNHDPDWRSYGVGMQLLVSMIESDFDRGERLFELGGEANDWKLDFTNGADPVYSLRLSMPTFRGFARRTLSRFRS